MSSNREPQYFSERSRTLNIEGALQDLTIFLGLAILAVTAALMYVQIKDAGLDMRAPNNLFLMMLAGLTLVNAGVFLITRRYRKIWLTIEKEAGIDKVTGVMNRIHFEKLLEEELRRGGRYHYAITLCYIDLDDFSAYTEQSGRAQGDQILKKFASILKGTTRFADCVARYQNDEFCVLLPHTDIVRAEKFMARLLAQVSEHLDFGISAGVTSYQAGESKVQFVMRSLAALNQAKRDGKRKIRYALSDSASSVNS